MFREQKAQNRCPGGDELTGKSTNPAQIRSNQRNIIDSTTGKENMLPPRTVQGGRNAETFGLPTEDVFSSPMILQELQRERESNGLVKTRKVVVDAEGTPMMLSREQDSTAEVTTGEIGSKIPRADSSVRHMNYDRKGGNSSRTESKIPRPSPSDLSSMQNDNGCEQSRPEGYLQGNMDTELLEADISLDGYSAYVNPLSFDEENWDISQISKMAITGNMQMDTPEAFRLLQKLSAVQLDDSAQNDEVAVDWNLRTGPKKLSPEPSKDYEIKAPKTYGMHKNGGYISKKKKVFEGREENGVTDQHHALSPSPPTTRVYSEDIDGLCPSLLAPGFIRLGTMNSGTARGVLYEPTTDEEDQQMKGIQGVDESGDENQVSDEDENKQLRMESEKRADVPLLASPVVHNIKATVCNYHATEPDYQTAYDSHEGIVPPTLNPSPRFKESRDVSPVAFSLPPDSCDKEVCSLDKIVTGEQENNSSDKASSFSFGQGGQAEPVDTQITAKLPNGEDKASSAGESVDQPNPFVSMMGHLRHNGPESLQSPLGRGKVQHELPNTPGSHEKQPTDSPSSPSMCTPVNLISASVEGKSAPHTPDLGLGDLDAWIDHRGLSLITTPARRDLRKMWDAVRDLSSTTENYRKAIDLNEKLKKEIEAALDAEAEARIAAKSGSEWAIAEIKKSEESASQMMSLAHQIQQAFSLCEQEKRKLAAELDQARETLEIVEKELRNSHESVVDPHAQQLLDSLNKAKELGEHAREEANIAEEEAYNSQGRVLQVHKRDQNDVALLDSGKIPDAPPSGQWYMQSKQGIDTDSRVRSKVSFFESLAQHDSGLETLLKSIEFVPSSSEKSPLLMVPNTTPVDFDDTTTPYRIHMEAMHVLRQSLNQEDTSAISEKSSAQTDIPLEEDWDTSSDENISEYDQDVSPISIESLTRLSRSTLRDKVRDRLIRLKTELQDAKNRLNHVEMGLHTPSMRKLNKENKFVPRSVQKEVRFSEDLTTTHDALPRKDGINLELSNKVKGSSRTPEEVVNGTSPQFISRASGGAILEGNDASYPDQQTEDSREIVSLNANASDSVSDNGLDTCVQDPQPKMLQPCKGIETEEQDFTISASRPGGSTRSRFAMKYGDEFSTPSSKTPRRGAFTPQTGFSVARYTSTTPSSAASAASPSTLGFEPLRHRMWRGGDKKQHSDSEEKEFRRRAAALKIHVSPYFRKNRATKTDRNEIDTVL
eukprot:jgi/Picsp_1/1104/NSC_04587-R1_---NA---